MSGICLSLIASVASRLATVSRSVLTIVDRVTLAVAIGIVSLVLSLPRILLPASRLLSTILVVRAIRIVRRVLLALPGFLLLV